MSRPVEVKGYNGQRDKIQGIIPQARVWIDCHKSKLDLYVLNIDEADVILGMPWLETNNPTIEWTTRQMSLTSRNKQVVLKPAPTQVKSSDVPVLMSVMQLKKALKNPKGSPVYLAMVTPATTPSKLEQEIIKQAHSDGATARLRETSKTRKYANIPDRDPSFQFTPIVIETYGRLGNQSIQFIDTLTKSGKEAHPQALNSLPNLAKRTISVCIQRENAKMLANYRASCIVGHCPQKALQHCLIAG